MRRGGLREDRHQKPDDTRLHEQLMRVMHALQLAIAVFCLRQAIDGFITDPRPLS